MDKTLIRRQVWLPVVFAGLIYGKYVGGINGMAGLYFFWLQFYTMGSNCLLDIFRTPLLF
jgi:hypothetical protein